MASYNSGRNPYCGKFELSCPGEQNGMCGGTGNPCTAPYDLQIEGENYHLKFRTYMMKESEIKKIFRTLKSTNSSK